MLTFLVYAIPVLVSMYILHKLEETPDEQVYKFLIKHKGQKFCAMDIAKQFQIEVPQASANLIKLVNNKKAKICKEKNSQGSLKYYFYA